MSKAGAWPVNVGLVERALREIMIVTLSIGVMAGGVSYLLGWVLPRVQQRIMERGGPNKMVMQLREAVLGAQAANALPSQIAASFQWTHPVLLGLLWTHAILACTRVPAAEVERGSIDVLMGLPISRWQLYFSETLSIVLSSSAVILLAVLGAYLARADVIETLRVPWDRVWIVAANLAALQWLVIGMALLFSTLSERRGRAVLVCILVLLGWVLLNFVGQAWEPAKKLEVFSALRYHQPLELLRTGAWPVKDLAVLLGAGTLAWVAGGIVMARRAMTSL